MNENILLDILPKTVTVEGEVFPICSDFRTCIILEKILDEKNTSNKNKVEDMLDLFYSENKPNNVDGAIKAILNFYSCGAAPAKQKTRRMNGNVEIKPKMIYSYEHDAPYIFGAFLTQYRIDLNEIEYLHWWKFQAMFKSLEEHNKIVEIMSYRATDVSKIKDKSERDRIVRMKNLYALPENLTVEDRVARAGAVFGGGMA